MSKKTLGVLLVVSALLGLLLVPAVSADSGPRTYQVTITNDTGGQPMTPPLASTHKNNAGLFDFGQAATEGVQQIAENGNLAPALDERNGNKKVFDVVVGFPDPENHGPLVPGGVTSFEITADGGAKYFSFVSMLVCTNDGFTGVDNVKLPKKVGDTFEADLGAYDAGTEANTENFWDLVPPCANFSGVSNPPGSIGTGMSNPNLAQMGVVYPHGNITGSGSLGADGNLTVEDHAWGDVGTIKIERTG